MDTLDIRFFELIFASERPATAYSVILVTIFQLKLSYSFDFLVIVILLLPRDAL